MAKCPKCGKIWSCSGEGVEMYYLEEGEEFEHCGTCRCDKCRNKPKTDIIDGPKLYHKMHDDWVMWTVPIIGGFWYSKDYFGEVMNAFDATSGLKIMLVKPIQK